MDVKIGTLMLSVRFPKNETFFWVRESIESYYAERFPTQEEVGLVTLVSGKPTRLRQRVK